MINFRYHIVSLTAVFLALVIGIAMGTTVVSKATVDGLRTNLDRVEARSTKVQGENEELRAIVRDRDTVDDALEERMVSPAVHGVLNDVPIVVIMSAQTDRTLHKRAMASLAASGANVEGTLIINDRMVAAGENTDRIAQALDVDPGTNVQRTLISRLSALLASAAGMTEHSGKTTSTTAPAGTTTPPTTAPSTPPDGEEPEQTTTTTTTLPPKPQEPELIRALRTSGFLEYRPTEGNPSDLALAGSDYRYVVLADVEPDVPNTQFIVPLVTQVAQLGPAPLVAGSGVSDANRDLRTAFTELLNDHDDVRGRISTIDNLESYAGLLSLVYSLNEAGEGRHGQYGLGNGTSAVVPSVGS